MHTCNVFVVAVEKKYKNCGHNLNLLYSCCLDGLLFSSDKLVIWAQFHGTAECPKKISAYINSVLN